MFAIRFRMNRLNYWETNPLMSPRWKTFVQLCPNTPAVVTASTHLPIFISSYIPILTPQVVETLASESVAKVVEDVAAGEFACQPCHQQQDNTVPHAFLHSD